MTKTLPPYKKKAASKVSHSIVRLKYYYPGHKYRFHRRVKTNGTIFSCVPVHENGPFVCYILTSADLFSLSPRFTDEEKGLFPVPKIDVFLANDKLYEGEVMACDDDINVAVIKIKSDESLPTVTLTPFTDRVSVSPFGVSECQSPYPTKLFPGDELTVVFRVFGKPSDALVCSAIYSVNYIGVGYDHQPFFRINCKPTMNGAPVINCEGDVIGVSFYAEDCGAFLPVNVFLKWWKQVVTHGEIVKPCMGIKIANLYTADIGHLEAIVHDCDTSDGVIVEGVGHGSPAYYANMRSNDVICQCDGRPMRSFLEFTEFLWDNIGEVIEVKGVRNGCHFIWKVEIQAIKTAVLPESLAETVVTKDSKTEILPGSLAENVVTKDSKTEILPGSLAENVVTKDSKTEILPGILPGSLAENVVTKDIETAILPVSLAENAAKDKKRTKKEDLTGLKAKTRKGEGTTRTDADAVYDSVAAQNLDER